MALVEGLDDAVGAEMERIRAELKKAIKDSPHTMAEIASMAGVDQSSIYRFLSGATSALTDNVVRVGLIAGARLQISARPQTAKGERSSEDEQAPPFRIVRNEQSSYLGSKSSTSRTSSGSSRSATGNIKRMTAKAKRKSSTDQRRKTPPAGGGICGYNAQVLYLRKHIAVRPESRLRRSA